MKGLRAALGAASPQDSLLDGARILRELAHAATPDLVVLSSALWCAARSPEVFREYAVLSQHGMAIWRTTVR